MSGEGHSSEAKISRSKLSAWMWFERISKVATVIVGLAIVPLGGFMLKVTLFMAEGQRWTEEDASRQELEIKGWVEAKFDSLPPQHFREKVDKIEALAEENNREIQNLKLSVARIDSNVANILRILDE